MIATTGSSSRVLMWTAGVAVIVFSIVGIAAIMGWIPTSMGRAGEAGVMSKPGVVSSGATKNATTRPASVAAKPAPAERVAAAEKCAECGVIESTRTVTLKGEGSGIGAVGGAVLGGLLGNQVGSGRGNTAATAVGAVGGAVLGNEAEKRVKSNTAYEVTVRMDDGSSRVFNEASPPAWRNGDHVKIVNGAIRANS